MQYYNSRKGKPMSIKKQISSFSIVTAFLYTVASAPTSTGASQPNIPHLSKGTINVINENFKDLAVAITGQGKTPDGKTPLTYIQKIAAGEETKFNIQYLGGAQFYSITGVVIDGTTVPFTTSTCTNLNVDQHYKVTFTKVDDVVTHCKAELLDEAGQVVK